MIEHRHFEFGEQVDHIKSQPIWMTNRPWNGRGHWSGHVIWPIL